MDWEYMFADIASRRESGINIVPYPHPCLRHVAVEVKTFGDNLAKFARIMFDAMYERRGVGLAAPQMGVPLRLFVVNASVCQKEGGGTDYDPSKELVFVNPVVTPKKGRGMTVDVEGCLSVPGLHRPVPRPHSVFFEASDVTGKAFKGQYSGLPARIVQHENDHLDGRLFVDGLADEFMAGVPEWLQYLSTQFDGLRAGGKVPATEALLEAARLAESLA